MESSKVLCQSLIKNLANTLKIPVHLFDTKGQLLLSHSNLNEKTNPLLTDHKLFLEILEKSASGEIELYFDGLIFYVALLKDDFIIIAGTIIITQQPTDFSDPSVITQGKAIFDNASYYLVMGLKKQAVEDLSKLIDLNDNEKENIKGYNQGEALFVCGSKRMRINVVVTDQELDSFGSGGGL